MSRPRGVLALALAALGAAAIVTLAARGAHAQLGAVNPFSVGVAAGVALPLGDFADQVNAGWNVEGLLTLRVPVLPVSFRSEVGYHRFGAQRDFLPAQGGPDPLPPGASLDGSARIATAIANVVYTMPTRTLLVRPYLIGGVGYANLRTEGTIRVPGAVGRSLGPVVQQALGANGGVGVELPLGAFMGIAEVRYHALFVPGPNTTLVPIRVGLRF